MKDAALLFSFVVDLDQACFTVTSKGKKCLLMDVMKGFFFPIPIFRDCLAMNMDQSFPVTFY